MNCAELKEDIRRLKRVSSILTPDGDLASVKTCIQDAQELEDEILEKYLDDFAEKNQLGWTMEYANIFEVETMEWTGNIPRKISIETMVPLPGNAVLVGGTSGALRILKRQDDENDKWAVERLNEKYLAGRTVHSACVLADGTIVTCNGDGEIDLFQKGEDGKWVFGESNYFPTAKVARRLENGEVAVGKRSGRITILMIEGGELVYDDYTSDARIGVRDVEVADICSMSEGDFVVGFKDGIVTTFNMPEGEWVPEYSFRAFRGDKNENINSMVKVSEDEFLVGGNKGGLEVFNRGGAFDQPWHSQMIEHGDGENVGISAMARLDGRAVVVGKTNGELVIYRKDADGSWRLDEVVSHNACTNRIAVTDDGSIASGDGAGFVEVCSPGVRNLEGLKRHLKEIAEKGRD